MEQAAGYISVQVSESYYRKLMEKAQIIEPSLKSPSFDMLFARVVECLDDLEKGDTMLILDTKNGWLDVQDRTEHEKLKRQAKSVKKKQEAEGK